MDYLKQAEAVVKSLNNDEEVMKGFKANPIKTVEKILGVDLPDEQILQIIKFVTSKVDVGDIKEFVKKIDLKDVKKIFGDLDVKDVVGVLGSVLNKK